MLWKELKQFIWFGWTYINYLKIKHSFKIACLECLSNDLELITKYYSVAKSLHLFYWGLLNSLT